ncbi:hypothetical protein BJ508DRAFT_412817 [Ascobolus immersus RN42]|uniref:F-box domain-containing protein n=1 Tax=Ascobolus immersus RN42 TaxID=1160509 RepID=A0A3N4IFR6_ASCIM|nr:hypothetical protein BJ508DRAFT_412817 [Ascobolus immersus RN42]
MKQTPLEQTPLEALARDQHNLATSPQNHPTLLLLPVELRLSIYAFCSAYTLLNLSQTGINLRSEITTFSASILNKAYGYKPYPRDGFTIEHISKLANPEEAVLWYDQVPPFEIPAPTYHDFEPWYEDFSHDDGGRRKCKVACTYCFMGSEAVMEGAMVIQSRPHYPRGCCGSGFRFGYERVR